MNDATRTACQHLLAALSSPASVREEIFQAPSFKLVCITCEFSLNLLYGDLNLTEEDKTALKRYKPILEQLADEKLKFNKKVKVLQTIETEFLNILRDILKRHVQDALLG